jgi:hypothetical protein
MVDQLNYGLRSIDFACLFADTASARLLVKMRLLGAFFFRAPQNLLKALALKIGCRLPLVNLSSFPNLGWGEGHQSPTKCRSVTDGSFIAWLLTPYETNIFPRYPAFIPLASH